ncbi:alpha/beta hydrolase fold domain-containing protein, partial [Pseudomonas aeruginosa]
PPRGRSRCIDSCSPHARPWRGPETTPHRPPRRCAGTPLLYLHGGVWMLGGLDSKDFICADLAARRGLLVLAVDYRLAPEHPFTAAL